MNQAQQEKLTDLVAQSIHWQCRLDRYTSLAIGGPAAAIVRVDRRQQLQPLLAFLAGENIPWRLIGRGTNLLVRDDGFPGVIVTLGREFKTVVKQEMAAAELVTLQVGAGYSLAQLSRNCMEWGLAGIEFACGIPGTLGGAAIMNAGAWGSDMSSITDSVKLTTAEGEKKFDRPELDFSYRCWDGFAAYQGKAVIAEVVLTLKKGDSHEIRQYCRELQSRRQETQFCKYPNAGSFFKNPPNDSAGRLIDSSGLKGTAIGGAMVSKHHGNFLVNRGNATAEDVLKLMKVIQAKVKLESGVDLEPEVHFI